MNDTPPASVITTITLIGPAGAFASVVTVNDTSVLVPVTVRAWLGCVTGPGARSWIEARPSLSSAWTPMAADWPGLSCADEPCAKLTEPEGGALGVTVIGRGPDVALAPKESVTRACRTIGSCPLAVGTARTVKLTSCAVPLTAAVCDVTVAGPLAVKVTLARPSASVAWTTTVVENPAVTTDGAPAATASVALGGLFVSTFQLSC